MRAIRRFLAFIASRLFFVTLIVSLARPSLISARALAATWGFTARIRKSTLDRKSASTLALTP